MMKLHAKIPVVEGVPPAIARVVTDSRIPPGIRRNSAFLAGSVAELAGIEPADFRAVLVRESDSLEDGWIPLPKELGYLRPGDIIRTNPSRGELRVVFRRDSRTNALFFTERCNSRCLMCSQPPRNIDDSYRVAEMLETIKLIDPGTARLGVTGGEPTLDPDQFLLVLRSLKDNLPATAIFCLTNGRLFSYTAYVDEIAKIDHGDAIFCIPLYSDIDHEHDFIVQASGAFDQTVRGILNCGRYGVRVEIRVVIHGINYERLGALARFIVRNLPFVDHVALMGLEITGFTKANLEALWVDPVDYVDELVDAVSVLAEARVPVSIYNHQLCLLPADLWEYAKQSVSGWKNEYIDECRRCAALAVCGGFFASSEVRSSRGITAQRPEDVVGTGKWGSFGPGR